MSKLLLLLLCFISFHAFSQATDEAQIIVDSNLTVRLYDPPKDTSMNGFRVLQYSKDHIYYQIVVNNTVTLKAPNENLFQITLSGIREGMRNRPEYKIYSLIDIDTLIGGVPGKFIHFYNATTETNIKEMFYFITIQNNRSYSIATAIDKLPDENIKRDVQQFFKMVQFKGNPYDGFKLPSTDVYTARKPFVPLDYEYPATILSSPKTFVYKNLSTSALTYKDIIRKDKDGAVIINWKDYDSSNIADSSTEINDENVGHYMIINGQYYRGIVNEDSTYQNGSQLGEKIQSESFTIGTSLVVTANIRSRFLKDTTINWNGKTLPTIVIQSKAKLVYQNTQDQSSEQQSITETFYYFAKNVGLIRYSTKNERGMATWVLKEITQLKK